MADNGTVGRVQTLLSPKPAPPNQPETAAEQSEYAAGKLVGFAQSGLKAGYELASMASDAIVFAGNIVTGGVASQTKYVQDALQRNAARGAGIVNTASHPIDAANSFLQSIEERQNAAELLRANGNFYEAGKIEGALAQEVMPSPAGVTKVAKVGKASKAGAAGGAAADGVMIGKKVSLREKYLGRTPGKNSRTGQEVQDRMRAEGKLRDGPNGTEFKASDGEWYSIKDADMAHKTDAVTWWNETGRQYGAKSSEVRSWMLDSKNYTLDHYSINRSLGAQLSQTYLPPLK